MTKDLNSFIRNLFIFSAIIAIGAYMLSITLLKEIFPIVAWFLLGFFAIATFLFHYGLLKSSKGDPKKFVRYYMSATGVKLFVYMLFVIIYALIKRTEAVPFLISFCAFYFLYMIFEVITAQRTFKNKNS
jgi:hypothetical protein